MTATHPGPDRRSSGGASKGPATRAELEDELAYLQRSIWDLERERAAGDMSEAHYERLDAEYRGKVVAVERELAAHLERAGSASTTSAPEPDDVVAPGARAPRGRRVLSSRRARLVTGWGAFGSLAAAAVLLVLAVTHTGPFAGPVQLAVNARVQIMLAEADILGSKGDVTEALATYDRVLALEPTQPVALANGGWLARVAGLAQHEPVLVRNADAEIEAAVQADPGYALARAYDGVLLLDDRDEPARAVAQFRAMLADHPSAALLSSVRAAAVRAFERTAAPLPPRIAAAAPAAAGPPRGTA